MPVPFGTACSMAVGESDFGVVAIISITIGTHAQTPEIFYQCCTCFSDPVLDSNALVLYNRECSAHGSVWHREMIRDEQGRMRLRFPLDPDGPVFFKSDRSNR